ncbi:hypothetical protein ACFO5O_11135 [Geojedonia litorea]|uniref:O-Antigen ligase n=1 Tax=Geojedonia litorea TaxID=1268269 RepID=A0ABV9N7K3_9FLAO
MKIRKEKLQAFLFFVFLIISSLSSPIIQIGLLMIFGTGYFLIYHKLFKIDFKNTYYLSIILLSSIQFLLFFKEDYGINYIVNTGLIVFLIGISFVNSNVVSFATRTVSKDYLEKVLLLFFKINIAIMIYQYLYMCIDVMSINPFSSLKYFMSAGDFMKGIFPNSSVNMLIMSFFLIYFVSLKMWKYFVIATIAVLSTTYMSGIVLFLLALMIYGFSFFSFSNKIKSVVVLILLFVGFNAVSPNNVQYAKNILFDKINSKTDPARKIVSLEQTLGNWIDSPTTFLVGNGGGKFSSRVAFTTGGEYVSWFPESLIYKSNDFENNHFKLWNTKVLSRGYSDGTANQPFSHYNFIVGEFGLIGILLFLIYLYRPIKLFNKSKFISILLIIMLCYFLLDYWFEYFSVIIFFELFMGIYLKENEASKITV